MAINPTCPRNSAKFGQILPALDELIAGSIQGQDLNLRPSGYEFDFWPLDHVRSTTTTLYILRYFNELIDFLALRRQAGG